MKIHLGDIPPAPHPVPVQTWVLSVFFVEILAIIIGMLVLIAFGIERKKAFISSVTSVVVSFFAGMTIWLLLDVI